MARIFDEKFETPSGYDETWSGGETVSAGSTLDEDYDISNLSTQPSDWGAECLRSIAASNSDNAYVSDAFGDQGNIIYLAFDCQLIESHLSGQFAPFFWFTDAAVSKGVIFYAYDSGGSTVILAGVYINSTDGFQYYAGPVMTTDTLFRVEFRSDESAGEWEWRVNGVNQPNNVDSSAPITSPGTIGTGYGRPTVTIAGWISPSAGTPLEIVFDNIALDTSDWPSSFLEIPTASLTLAANARHALLNHIIIVPMD